MTTHLGPPARVVGAYAIQPPAPDERVDFIRQVLAMPGCDGLEVSYDTNTYSQDRQWLWDVMVPGGRHVLTLIGGEMQKFALDPNFGLGSATPAGRRAALDLLRHCRDEVEARTKSQEQTIVAVEVHSLPTVDPQDARATADRFTDSLAEAASWDWCGAALVVEHCDARTVEHSWQKGLLAIALEIEAVHAVRHASPTTRVGMSVNWGRSAIETRDPGEPDLHARLAREAGLLMGVMFSGASDLAGAYGQEWADAHLPLRPGASANQPGEPTSLMTAAHVRSTLAAAGPGLIFDGLKVSIRPGDQPISKRIALIAPILAALASARPLPLVSRLRKPTEVAWPFTGR